VETRAPGRFAGTLLSAGSKMQKRVQEASGIEDWFIHACRHTVETMLAELQVQPHIRDLLLDHASNISVAAAAATITTLMPRR